MLTEKQKNKAKAIKLSDNFTLWELIESETHPSLMEYPCPCIRSALKDFAQEILQPVRNRWGRLDVNSCYRPSKLNAAVKGVKNSVHQILFEDEYIGVAGDIVPKEASLREVFEWCNPTNIPGLKTAILYDTFIHLDIGIYRAAFQRLKKTAKGYEPI